LRNIPADELKPNHLKRYLVYCYEKLQLKAGGQINKDHLSKMVLCKIISMQNHFAFAAKDYFPSLKLIPIKALVARGAMSSCR
jgi:hypothetical protein